ncbi:MAG TPA: glycoside hydrolase family 15 protein [Solirubrobacteraceae bacterium]|nr:glycoside hydrolase family 15 protein [Solirubrobacteraceae bacterium]
MRPTSCCRRGLSAALVALAIAVLVPAAAGAAQSSTAPGAPGAKAFWTPANKQGFGTSTTMQSKLWHTLQGGELTEVYYPDLSTPALRDLQLIVTDGRTFTDRESDATNQHVQLVDKHSLTYRQVNTAKSGRYRIVKTYVTDPARNALLVDVRFQSLTGRPYQVYAYVDPSLSNDGNDDSGTTSHGALLTQDATAGSALVAEPSFGRTSTGYLDASDGWVDLRDDHRMDWQYRSSPAGNVVQTAQTQLDGRRHQHLQLALGFGANAGTALSTARASLQRGFARVAGAYADGWHRYLGSLKREPASAKRYGDEYDISVMTLAAHEDKANRGAFVASPTMPWVWGTGLETPSGVYHAVWSRDLYQIVTAMLAAGDRGAADRALTYLFDRQQKPDGSFWQNTLVDGTPHWSKVQEDEVAFPIVLAWQLGRDDAATYHEHVKRAADYIVATGPKTQQDRWENQDGWSPGTIAAEVAGLVCAADLARKAGDEESAKLYEKTADLWQNGVEASTATSNGPYSTQPYYLRLTKDGNPNDGSTYSIGDGGPRDADERTVVDPSFLELVRLGVKRPKDQTIVNSIAVVDQEIAVDTPNGRFWHRFNFDGYGETKQGGPWDISAPDTGTTFGRAWPIFAGERGEYNLTAGVSANDQLAAMAGAANEGGLIPEQVWDDQPPSGSPGFPPGEGTLSATPLAWSHAQFVRLAWSIQAGHPVEQPSVVACRYARDDC